MSGIRSTAAERGDASASESADKAVFAVLEALELSLRSTASGISESQQFLATSFEQIAANFAAVHSIAMTGEKQEAQTPNDTVIALRRVVDRLTLALQFEDALSQSLGCALRRIESISAALNQTRSIVSGAHCGRRDDGQDARALALIARTLDSLRNAEHPPASRMREAGSGSVAMF